MTDNTYNILYGEEIPQDLFSSSHSVPVYDIEKKATTGEEVTLILPYNAVEKKWSTLPERKALLHLYGRLHDEGYVLWIPEYRGEKLSLLAEKGGKRYLILIVLDSESEKKVWIAKENTDAYTVVVIREKVIDEKGAHSISLDMALSSFNFLSL
ncbi:MAG: hypothetical protein MSS69_02110 [Spirochaetales bacterium]|nr:hypothetical protein [Spirochaetales bacterium]